MIGGLVGGLLGFWGCCGSGCIFFFGMGEFCWYIRLSGQFFVFENGWDGVLVYHGIFVLEMGRTYDEMNEIKYFRIVYMVVIRENPELCSSYTSTPLLSQIF